MGVNPKVALESYSKAYCGAEFSAADSEGSLGVSGDVVVGLGATSQSCGMVSLFALRQGLSKAVLFASDESMAARLGRRAEHYTTDIDVVWASAGEFRKVQPEPVGFPVAKRETLAFANDLIERAGWTGRCATLAAEYGASLVVKGLEVARIDDAARHMKLAIGVGEADREIHSLLDDRTALPDALAAVCELVDHHRQQALESFGTRALHPLGEMAKPALWRWAVGAAPQQFGFSQLRALPALKPGNEYSDYPVFSTDSEGSKLVVFTHGPFVDLPGEIGDYLLATNAESDLEVVVLVMESGKSIYDKIRRVAAMELQLSVLELAR